MDLPRLPPAVLAPSVRVTARWVFSPRPDWPTRRRRVERAQRLPGPPRGTWIRERELGGVPAEAVAHGSASGSDAVLLYLHGGGYCVGSPRSWRAVTALLARGFGAPVLAVDYRLAPEHPHPAALQDARTAWSALVDTAGWAPERIVLAGDSAGAGLALALALDLRDRGAALPAAIGLIAPWLDLVPDLTGARRPRPGDAILSRGLLRAFAAAYLGAGASAESPLVSPLRGDLRGLPPLLVSTSEHDLLRDDAEQVLERSRRDGVSVSFASLPGLWHDPFAHARLLSGPSADAPVRFGAALRERLDGAPS